MEEENIVNVADLLKEQIYNISIEIDDLQPGTEQRSRAVKDFEVLYSLLIDQQKMMDAKEHSDRELELEKERANRESLEEMKKEKNQKVDRIMEAIKFGAGLLVPLSYGTYMVMKTLKFEETGSICSMVGKTAISNAIRNVFSFRK